MRTIIITNGEIKNVEYIKKIIREDDYIISVDGAIKYVFKMDIVPDIALGDFDSIEPGLLEIIKEKNIPMETFPCKKDKTDTELAIDLAIEKGSSDIILLGGLGSRIDHSFTNLALMARLCRKGIKCRVFNENNDCYFIKDKIIFNNIEKIYNISIVPISSEVVVKKTEGLYYPLENATIPLGSSWGVSNVAIEDKVCIEISKGIAMIILARD